MKLSKRALNNLGLAAMIVGIVFYSLPTFGYELPPALGRYRVEIFILLFVGGILLCCLARKLKTYPQGGQ
jgi:hypothetical protein